MLKVSERGALVKLRVKLLQLQMQRFFVVHGSRLCPQWGGADRLMQLGTAMAAAKALQLLCYVPLSLQPPILHWASCVDQLSTR